MIIRQLQIADLYELRKIHDKFYKNEFEMPDFFDGFLGSFVVVDNDKIITAGGIRPIAEAVAITNKDLGAEKRREALYKFLEVSSFICNKTGLSQLHAFVQDKNWERHLRKIGFNSCKGDALYLNV